jgi:hypothetical protein
MEGTSANRYTRRPESAGSERAPQSAEERRRAGLDEKREVIEEQREQVYDREVEG